MVGLSLLHLDVQQAKNKKYNLGIEHDLQAAYDSAYI